MYLHGVSVSSSIPAVNNGTAYRIGWMMFPSRSDGFGLVHELRDETGETDARHGEDSQPYDPSSPTQHYVASSIHRIHGTVMNIFEVLPSAVISWIVTGLDRGPGIPGRLAGIPVMEMPIIFGRSARSLWIA